MVGANIETIKRVWGLKQTEFAGLFDDMNYQKISSYVNGRAKPSVEFMIRLAELTGLSVIYLYKNVVAIPEIPPGPLTKEEFAAISKVGAGKENVGNEELKSLQYRVTHLESEVAELKNKSN